MATKRHHYTAVYAEDSFSDDDDDLELEVEPEHDEAHQGRPRPGRGRPRKSSLTTNSSMENDTSVAPARRRGRGPSKRPCLNRNALMARENRQRKKEYIERIENKLQQHQQENQNLNNTITKQSIEIKRLTNEVVYLKNVLKNHTLVTSLLKSMNDSLRKMHGSNGSPANGLDKVDVETTNGAVSGQTNTPKTNNLSVPPSGFLCKDSLSVYKADIKKINPGQVNDTLATTRIARKTMPLNNCPILKTEDPPSIESLLEEDNIHIQKSSPESNSYCEYNADNSPVEFDNQLPTTPFSNLSNSMDTDFSKLSSFNVDLFDNLDNIDDVANPLQFEQETPDFLNEETLFHTLDKEPGFLNDDIIDPLKINKMSEALNEKNVFNSLDNTGVCLHINSTRVSLEYCSICHLNSLNNEIA